MSNYQAPVTRHTIALPCLGDLSSQLIPRSAAGKRSGRTNIKSGTPSDIHSQLHMR